MDRRRFQIIAVWAASLCMGCAGTAPSTNPLAAVGLGRQAPLASAWNGSAQNTSQSASSSVFGSTKKPEPTVTERLTSAVVDNRVSKAVTNATHQTVAYLTPKPKTVAEVDPLRLSNKTKTPGADLFIQMAAASEQADKIEQAEALYKKAVAKEPKNLDALLGYARFCDRQNRLNDAVYLYSRAVKTQPGNATAHNDLALCYARHHELGNSLASLEKAVALKPKNKLYRNNIAKVLTKMNRTDAALQHLLAVNPPAVAHYNLGFFLKGEGREQLATEHVSRSVQMDPSFSPSRQWLAALKTVSPTTIASRPDRYTSQVRVPQQTKPVDATNPTYLQAYQSRSMQAGRNNFGQPTAWQAPTERVNGQPVRISRYSRPVAQPAASLTPVSSGKIMSALRPLPPVSTAIITR